jgi:hypothetical protein
MGSSPISTMRMEIVVPPEYSDRERTLKTRERRVPVSACGALVNASCATALVYCGGVPGGREPVVDEPDVALGGRGDDAGALRSGGVGREAGSLCAGGVGRDGGAVRSGVGGRDAGALRSGGVGRDTVSRFTGASARGSVCVGAGRTRCSIFGRSFGCSGTPFCGRRTPMSCGVGRARVSTSGLPMLPGLCVGNATESFVVIRPRCRNAGVDGGTSAARSVTWRWRTGSGCDSPSWGVGLRSRGAIPRIGGAGGAGGTPATR